MPEILFGTSKISESEAIRCWICGDNAEPHSTNPMDPNKGNFDPGANAWCSSMVTSAACQGGGNDLVCYKEIWNVDGVTSK